MGCRRLSTQGYGEEGVQMGGFLSNGRMDVERCGSRQVGHVLGGRGLANDLDRAEGRDQWEEQS